MSREIQDTPRAPYIVLAALSFDETGDWALYEALRIVQARANAELHVVHVASQEGPLETSDALRSLDRRLELAPAEIEKRLERAFEASPPCKVIAHIRVGSPARSIVQAAIDLGADLIVVGSHRRTRLDRLLLGSVAEKVLHESYCPVLIAQPKNYQGTTRSPSIEPPCEACMQTRESTKGQTYWCERHSRSYRAPHVYEPTPTQRNSVMPSV